VGAYDTLTSRQAVYDQYRAALAELMMHARRHVAEAPECGARPLCIGGELMASLDLTFALAPDQAILYVAVAVHELIRADDREKVLTAQLAERGPVA
jgi:hypothetical protein